MIYFRRIFREFPSITLELQRIHVNYSDILADVPYMPPNQKDQPNEAETRGETERKTILVEKGSIQKGGRQMGHMYNPWTLMGFTQKSYRFWLMSLQGHS